MDGKMFQSFVKLTRYVPPTLSEVKIGAPESAISSPKNYPEVFKNITKNQKLNQKEYSTEFHCAICFKPFLHENNAQDHIYTHMSWEELGATDIFHVDCGFCGRIFLNSGDYLMHLKTHNQTHPLAEDRREIIAEILSDEEELFQGELLQVAFENKEANETVKASSTIKKQLKLQDSRQRAKGDENFPICPSRTTKLNSGNLETTELNKEEECANYDWAIELVLDQINQNNAKIKDFCEIGFKSDPQKPPAIKSGPEEPLPESTLLQSNARVNSNWLLIRKKLKCQKEESKADFERKLTRDLKSPKIDAVADIQSIKQTTKAVCQNNKGLIFKEKKCKRPFPIAITQNSINQKKKIQLKEDFQRRREMVLKYLRTPTVLKEQEKWQINQNETMTQNCRKDIKRIENLQRYSKPQGVSKDKKFICSFCPSKFIWKCRRTRHEKTHFKKQTRHKSLGNYKPFVNKQAFARRLSQYLCYFCGHNSRKPGELLHHVVKHTGETPYECSVCRKQFGNNWAFNRHKKGHKKYGVVAKNLHYKETPTLAEFREIRIVQYPTRKYFCYFCGYNSRNISDLNDHLSKHTGETPYKCNVCCKQFGNTWSLYRHIKIHTNEITLTKFKCGNCKWKFQSGMELKLHQVRKVCEEDKMLVIKCIKFSEN